MQHFRPGALFTVDFAPKGEPLSKRPLSLVRMEDRTPLAGCILIEMGVSYCHAGRLQAAAEYTAPVGTVTATVTGATVTSNGGGCSPMTSPFPARQCATEAQLLPVACRCWNCERRPRPHGSLPLWRCTDWAGRRQALRCWRRRCQCQQMPLLSRDPGGLRRRRLHRQLGAFAP